MKQALGYIRVSTDRQGEHGISLDVQRHHIESYAREAGYRIVQIYDDAHTGMGADSVKDRPGLNTALDYAKQKRCPIIVADVDRMGRHAESLHTLIDQGILISASHGKDADRAVLKASADRAQRNGELISERTKQALAGRKAQGVSLGNRKNLKEAQEKGKRTNQRRAALRLLDLEHLIEEIRSKGATKAREIADELNRRLIPTAQGKRWTEDNIRPVLRRIAKERRKREEEADQRSEAQRNPLFGSW